MLGNYFLSKMHRDAHARRVEETYICTDCGRFCKKIIFPRPHSIMELVMQREPEKKRLFLKESVPTKEIKIKIICEECLSKRENAVVIPE